ncbi:MAG: hypothetical protein ACR2PZ_22815 [Pseudomonadales bacterium]
MDTHKVSNWVQVGANIGILGGLLLVGIQINQNTSAIKAQMNTSAQESLLQSELAMMGENPALMWAKSIESPSDLTLSEQRVMDAYIYLHYMRWRHSYYSAGDGFVDEDQWRWFAEGDAPFILGNPYARSWWERYKEEGGEIGLPPALREVIEQSLLDASDHTADYFSTIREGLQPAGLDDENR